MSTGFGCGWFGLRCACDTSCKISASLHPRTVRERLMCSHAITLQHLIPAKAALQSLMGCTLYLTIINNPTISPRFIENLCPTCSVIIDHLGLSYQNGCWALLSYGICVQRHFKFLGKVQEFHGQTVNHRCRRHHSGGRCCTSTSSVSGRWIARLGPIRTFSFPVTTLIA